jgi:hypothetical protein
MLPDGFFLLRMNMEAKVIKNDRFTQIHPIWSCNCLIINSRYLMAQKVMKSGGKRLNNDFEDKP